MTTQTAAQTATLGSMDLRLQATLDGKDALIDDLREERNDLRTQLTDLRATVTALEGALSAFRDQAFAEIRDLRNEVGDLRSSDTQWKRWAGVVLGMYATVAERLRQATGDASPDLPPSPPLTHVP
jgi:chromosome segregation ATPase